MAGHFRALGIIWLIVSGLRMLPGLFLYFLSRGDMPFIPPEVPLFVHGIIRVFAVFLLFAGGIGLAAGWGLLARQPWARMLAIVLGVINLLDIPVGTALGIYTLWALLPSESERQYREAAGAAQG